MLADYVPPAMAVRLSVLVITLFADWNSVAGLPSRPNFLGSHALLYLMDTALSIDAEAGLEPATFGL